MQTKKKLTINEVSEPKGFGKYEVSECAKMANAFQYKNTLRSITICIPPHVIFENFSVTNMGSTLFAGRVGIELRVNGSGSKNIRGSIIRHCEFFNINGHWDKLEGNGGGAALLIKATGNARFVDTIIEHNYIHDVSRSGIWGNYNAGKPGTKGTKETLNHCRCHRHCRHNV